MIKYQSPKHIFLIVSGVFILFLIVAKCFNPTTTIRTLDFLYFIIPFAAGGIGLILFIHGSQQFSLSILIAGILCSSAMICWSLGNVLWMYYYFADISDIPYPSFADVLYLLFSFQFLAGITILARSFKKSLLPDLHYVSPYIILLLVNSYLILFTGHSVEEIMKSMDSLRFARYFLGMVYTLLDVALISIALICLFGKSFVKLNRQMKSIVAFITAGLIVNYIAGLIFNIQLSLPTGHPNSELIGCSLDFLYAIEFSLLGYAIICLSDVKKSSEP